MLDFIGIACPHCGEPLQLAVDASAGAQQYVEDCQVCCRPMLVTLRIDDNGELNLDVAAEGA